MGKRGPKSKPTNLKVLEGMRKDRINTEEPRPKPVSPKCPSFLPPEAKRIWKKLAAPLEQLGLLTEIDGATLAAFCAAYARWEVAEKMLKDKDGGHQEVIETTNGNKVQNPYVGIAHTAMKIMLQYGRELGLSPSARSSLSISKLTGEEDPMEKLLKARGG